MSPLLSHKKELRFLREYEKLCEKHRYYVWGDCELSIIPFDNFPKKIKHVKKTLNQLEESLNE